MITAPTAAADERPRPADRRTDVRIAVVLVTLTAVPCIAAGLEAIGRTWHPAGDWAMLELRTLDVGTDDTPLVGPYSRFGWNHPGPLLFWALAIPYHVSGQSSTALLVGAAAINAAAVVGCGWLAWRRGGLALTILTSAGLGVLLLAVGAPLLRDPWNPWVTPLPFALFVLAVWSTLELDRYGPAIAVLAGSFVVQSHVGYAAIVGALSLLAVAGWVVRRGSRRPLLVAAVVLGVCWAPVAVDQLAGSANALDVAEQVSEPGDTVGVAAALGHAGRQLAPLGPWAGGHEPLDSDGGGVVPAGAASLVVPLAAFTLALVAARAAREPRAVRFLVVVGVAAVAGTASVARIHGQPFDYLLRWWWPTAALWWIATTWALLRWARMRFAAFPPLPARGATLAVVGLVLVASCTPAGTTAASGDLPADEWTPVIDTLTAETLDHIPASTTVVVERDGPSSGWVKDGITLQLAKAGIDLRVEDHAINRYKFGRHRLADDERTAPAKPIRLCIITGDAALRLVRSGDHHVVAAHLGSRQVPAVVVQRHRQRRPSAAKLQRSPSRERAAAGASGMRDTARTLVPMAR